MATLHPMLRTSMTVTDAATGAAVACTTVDDAAEVVLALDAVAEHLQDAIDILGSRASGFSLASAARRLADALPQLTSMTRRDPEGRDPMPARVRCARKQLRDADLALDELSRCALALVPQSQGEQARLDLQLCRWVDAARLLATWVEDAARA